MPFLGVFFLARNTMCGIFGVLGDAAEKKVLTGLQKLEYRGYDSWGIAGISKNSSSYQDSQQDKIFLEKHVGKIGKVTQLQLPESKLALGHTRWATHGGVTEQNAHPHLARDGSFALVQNGVVENSEELKEACIKNDYSFKTETDTEVIVTLIEHEITQNKKLLSFQVFTEVVSRLKGRNSVALITKKGELMAVRYGSPLVVGCDPETQKYFISSDLHSLRGYAKLVYTLQKGEGISISVQDTRLHLFNQQQEHLNMEWQKISQEEQSSDLGKFTHFMEKEIQEQPQAFLQTCVSFKKEVPQLLPILKSKKRVFTLGIGSAGFAASQLAFYLRESGYFATSILANEAESYKNCLQKEDSVIVFSQSGETADTLEVVEWMKEKGVVIVSLVNAPDSSLAQLSNFACNLGVGPEIGVASTKALTAQMIWGKLLSLVLTENSLDQVEKSVIDFSTNLESWLKKETTYTSMELVLQQLTAQNNVFVLGRGQLLMPALEGALKLKEITYMHAEGMSSGELKHGTLALIQPGSLVICLLTDDAELTAQQNAIAEIKARGGKVIGVAPNKIEAFDYFIPTLVNKNFAAVASIIPLQLLAYKLALIKGFDPDKPRNLAKSVTVK